MKDEALRLALEALESTGENNGYHGVTQYFDETIVDQAITAIKAALEAKDEPVAWMFQHEETGRTMCVDAQQLEWGFEKGNPRLKKIAPLYTTPPQRKPLTDEEIGDEFVRFQVGGMFTPFLYAVRAIEAAHGIKGEA